MLVVKNLQTKFLPILKKYYPLLVCWGSVTLIHLNKAFHIDDSFHLEAAKYIIDNLFSPMSGYINWGDSPTPMYEHNQPPLFFLVIGIVNKLFNLDEMTLHVLLSIFSFLALFYFQKIIQLLQIKKTGIYLTLLAFNPAFIVNQNLMTDIPILACALVFFYFLLKSILGQGDKNISYAMIALSFGLLIKYALLPELIVAIIGLLLSKKFKQLTMLLIPVITLTLWSMWNYYEFGEIHLFGRPQKIYSNLQLWAFIGTLGAISSFSLLIIPAFLKKQFSNSVISIITAGIVGCLVYVIQTDELTDKTIQQFLHSLFLFNGTIVLLFIGYKFIVFYRKEKEHTLRITNSLLLVQICLIATFIVVYAPFMATRHLLLILPFILLYFKNEIEQMDAYFKTIFLSVSISFGLILGISDYSYADFYRVKAKEICLSRATKWTVGHWGWQWYAKKAGMKIYSLEDDWKLKKGDYLIVPKNISKQTINQNLKFDTLYYLTEKFHFTTLFSGNDFASMYNSFYQKPAWTISKSTVDTIYVCKITKSVPYRKKLTEVEKIIVEIKNDPFWYATVKTKAKKQKIPLDSMLLRDAKWLLEQK